MDQVAGAVRGRAGIAELRAWWERPGSIAALLLLGALPLFWPDIPPLIDLPGHIGRYKVELDLANSDALRRFYRFEWALIGNLGVDLLVIPLSKIFGLEPAVKLIVLTIPSLTMAGFLWVAHEVHGRIPPTALFALPLAYGHPFIFGFVNFALSMALAFLAFGLWLRLARSGRLRLRAALFVPIAALIWLTHVFGWGVLGIMVFSAEFVRQMDRGKPLVEAGAGAVLHCLPLTPPILLMLAWRGDGEVGGETGDWFNFRAKLAWLTASLRDRWMVFDLLSLAAVILLLVKALRQPTLRFSRNLAASALFLLLIYVLLPRVLLGSAFADMRLAPYMLAVALLAIRMGEGAPPALARRLALAGGAFFLIRIVAATASFYLYDRDHDRELAALDHVPLGARMVSFVGVRCDSGWVSHRKEHLPAFAIVRRAAFSNDQWVMPGAQLLSVDFPAAGAFTNDPSQMVRSDDCQGSKVRYSLNEALRLLPRGAFDHVWLIDPPAYDPALLVGMEPVWRSGASALYGVVDDSGSAPSQNPD